MKREIQSSPESSRNSRREFLTRSGTAAAATALAAMAPPPVHAAEDNTIRLALIGCGGRGTGAARDALSVADGGPLRLFIMADLFENRLATSHKTLGQQFGDKVDVPPERQFVGFDAHRKAIDSLRPGDVAMLTG
ncbi:MAG: twin-arginine translocation signal domain-containing protein, partial [Planctomycetota bacterium]